MSSSTTAPATSKVVRIGPYKLGKTLGIGSFCKVKLAVHEPTGQKVAIKILNRKKLKKQDMGEKVRTEIMILRIFQHPHIIRLYEVIDKSSDIYAVMEYVPGGELFDYIVAKGKLDEREARRFFQEIISGVEYCHAHMVVHRDLKPENLLLDADNKIKIADFGLSNRLRDGHFLKTSCGSPNYAAPEVISGNLYAGPEVDVWSCGVILYALLCGSLPFDDENIRSLFKKIKNGVYSIPAHVSSGARDLIQRMLVVDPLKRMTMQQIQQHPWYRANLPAYLAVSSEQLIEAAQQIDDQIVQRVVNLGFTHERVLRALSLGVEVTTSKLFPLTSDVRKIAVIYHLLKDQKRKREQRDDPLMDEKVNLQLQMQQNAPKDSANNNLLDAGNDIEESRMSAIALASHRALLQVETTKTQQAQKTAKALLDAYSANAHHTHTQPGASGAALAANLTSAVTAAAAASGAASSFVSSQAPAAGRWRLGRLFRDDPQRIMGTIYATLKKYNFEWKVLSLYRIKARWPAGLVDRQGRPVSSADVVKVGIQLYRTTHSLPATPGQPVNNALTLTPAPPHFQIIHLHVIDFHKLYGQMFLFLELSSHLLNDLAQQLI